MYPVTVTTDRDGRPIILGSYVRSARHGHIGRVTDIDLSFAFTGEAGRHDDDGEGWLAGQTIPVSEEQRQGRWISILVHNGGAVLVPVDSVEVIEPFPFVNDFAAFYFGE